MMPTVKDVAERLNVGRSTVHDWVNSGKLAAFKVGGVVRIDEDVLENFIDSGCRSKSPRPRTGGSRTTTPAPASRLRERR